MPYPSNSMGAGGLIPTKNKLPQESNGRLPLLCLSLQHPEI